MGSVAPQRRERSSPKALSLNALLRLAVGLIGCGIGLGLLVVFAFQSSGSLSSPVAIGQALTPWLFGVASVVIVVTAVTRQRFATIVLATGIIANGPLMWANQFQPSGATGGESDHIAIRVVASNVWYQNTQDNAAFDTLIAQNADVIVLAEVLQTRRRTLNTHRISELYPYRSDEGTRSGEIILSKYPLTVAEKTSMPHRLADVTIRTPDGPVRVIGVHLSNPTNNPQAWAAQLARLRSIVETARAPLVVAGDFNAGWFHPEYRRLLGDGTLVDARSSAGHPWSMTWPAEGAPGFPVVALDHVLCSSRITVRDAWRLQIPGADHFAVGADLLVPPRSPAPASDR